MTQVLKKCTAVVLSAGSGKRMNTSTKKQYLMVAGKPVIYYCMKTFQDSAYIDDIILVTSLEDIEYCKEEVVKKYGFTKVSSIICGGSERYNSVYNGIMAAGQCDYIFIHDGARPFVNEEIIERAYETLEECGTAVVGMPVKDTIKIVDSECNVADTPDRNNVWLVQTPQCFDYEIAKEAYQDLIDSEKSGELSKSGVNVTDDAMVVETFLKDRNVKVRLVKGSYENIKITTPEDLDIAQMFVKRMAEV